MKNKFITLAIGILLIMLVSAGAVVYNITTKPAEFTPKSVQESVRHSGDVIYDCGGKRQTLYLDVPNLRLVQPNFDRYVKYECQKEITNARDWIGRDQVYNEKHKDCIDFDANAVKKCVCGKEAKVWNATSVKCEEPEIEK